MPMKLTPEEEVAAAAEVARAAAADAVVAAELKRHSASTARPDVLEYLSEADQKVKEEVNRQLAAGEDPLGDNEVIVQHQQEADELNAAEAEGTDAGTDTQEAAQATSEEVAEAERVAAEAAAKAATDAEAAAQTARETAGLTPEQVVAAEAAAQAAASAAAEAQTAAAATSAAAAGALAVLDIPDPVLLPIEDTKKLDDAVETVQAKLDDIDKKWTTSEITDEEKIAQSAAARRELNVALRAQALNDGRIETNKLRVSESSQRVLDGMKKIAKADSGIDYAADEKAAMQFDQSVQLLGADPDNAKLSFSQIAVKAHAMVAAMRGITRKTTEVQATKPVAKPVAISPARTAPQGPITLRNIPSAATANTGGGPEEVGARLKGQNYETWFAAQPADVRRKLLDS